MTAPDTLTIPKPIKTHVQIWPAAWHWLVAGASSSNADVFDWAVEPLAGEEVLARRGRTSVDSMTWAVRALDLPSADPKRDRAGDRRDHADTEQDTAGSGGWFARRSCSRRMRG